MPLRLHNSMNLFYLQCPACNTPCLITDVCKLYRLDIVSKGQEHLGERLKSLVFWHAQGQRYLCGVC